MPTTLAPTEATQAAADMLAETLRWHEAGCRDKANEAAMITIAAALTALALKDDA
jgi:hypothetical protein